ncbi:hypothetical protein PEC18_01615 [Paucibacter sp. O1-1]|nr:hypothetical protein [Paucibacter sp. O1-1]MDA3824588.1 hypothetical protein [Paucibacter sp. O1-1]
MPAPVMEPLTGYRELPAHTMLERARASYPKPAAPPHRARFR